MTTRRHPPTHQDLACYTTITEDEWQTTVLQIASVFRWLAYHTHDSRRSRAGFPDLVLAQGGTVCFVELKKEAGVVEPEQRLWLRSLHNEHHPAYVWRPSQTDAVFAYLKDPTSAPEERWLEYMEPVTTRPTRSQRSRR